jgi:hypothetical protein
MKTISLLGSIFLPATLLASIFSMTFFNFQSGKPENPPTCALDSNIVPRKRDQCPLRPERWGSLPSLYISTELSRHDSSY